MLFFIKEANCAAPPKDKRVLGAREEHTEGTGSMDEYVRRVKQLDRTGSSSPLRLGRIDIELTERCNNNCIHCCINRPENDVEAQAGEMTTGQVRDILKQTADLGCLQVRFTGGEPLLRPDFEEVYLFARRLGLKVLVFTNARLITPHLADLFARVPPRVEMEVTVYGMHKESYEAVTRAPDSFVQFRRGVNLLLQHNVPFIVKSALLRQNKRDMVEFEAWTRTIPWMKRLPRYSMFFELRSRRDNLAKNQLIESLRLSPQEGVAVLARDAGYAKEMSVFAAKFMGPRGARLFACGAGHGMCIDAYGHAQPCMGIRAPNLIYNLTGSEQDHKKTWREEEKATQPSGYAASGLRGALDQFSHLRELRATNPEYLRRCALCFLKGLCEQCPGRSWSENGTLDTPGEYLCEVAHVLARHLGWLGENEHGWEVTKWRERVKRTDSQGPDTG